MPFLSAPKVSKKELQIHLSKYFELGKLLSYKKLKKGFANSLYHIKTTEGDFVFKIAVRNNSDKINYEIDLLTKLKNLPTPKPLKTKTGKHLFYYKKHRAFIYPFLKGEEKNKFSNKMLFEVGEFLGKLHLQTKGYKSSIERFEYYALTKARLNQVVKKSAHFKNIKIKNTVFYLQENALKYKLSSNLPTGAMHIDVKPENTLFENGYISGVVDFDNSYNGPLIFDLADTLMWFCSEKGNFDMNAAKILYDGYTSIRKLTKNETGELLNALHSVFLGISICGIEFLINKKLPEDFVIWILDNLLETEKNLKIIEKEFQKIVLGS